MGSVKKLHVVGYKNSGKTTLINRWIRRIKEKDATVSVIKHHGHGAKLDMPDEKKDSMQYLHAGADVSLVAGGGYTQHMINQEASFQELEKLAMEHQPDIILVEGYKGEQGDKVVLVRDNKDWKELQEIEGIKLVIGLDATCAYPQINSREQAEQLDAWLLKWMQST